MLLLLFIHKNQWYEREADHRVQRLRQSRPSDRRRQFNIRNKKRLRVSQAFFISERAESKRHEILFSKKDIYLQKDVSLQKETCLFSSHHITC